MQLTWAIYGSRYWKVSQQENEHLSFTTNGKKLYAIKSEKPVDSFIIEPTSGWSEKQIKSVKLLGSDSKVVWEMTDKGLLINPPKDLGTSNYAWSFEILTREEQHHPDVIQTDADKAFEGTKTGV